MTLRKLIGIAVLGTLVILLSGILFCPNVRAANIYVNGKATGLGNGTSVSNGFVKLADITKLADNDVILISAGTYDGDFIIDKADVTIRRNGLGVVTIKPVGTGATFGILTRKNGLVCRDIYFDGSGCDSKASHFNIRVEGDATGPECIDCTFKEPPAKNYANHQTSRGQMNFDSISTDTEYSDVILTRVDFLNVKESLPSILDKADNDTTIVSTSVTTSATSTIGVSP